MCTADSSSDERLSISLLGEFSLRRGNMPLPRLPLQKSEHLLAYLVLRPGQMVSREQLAGILWPDADEEAARTSLRRALSTVHRILEPDEAESRILVATRQGVQFLL